MTTIKINELKKELKQLDNKELMQLVVELYKLNKDTKQFLSNKYLGEEAVRGQFEQTQKIIEDQFFPERGHPKMKLQEAKSAISSYKKMTGDETGWLDLMLYYVELGTEFTVAYGDIDEKFYYSMETVYDRVVTECSKNEALAEHFKDRLYMVFWNSQGVGWGYHDVIGDIYSNGGFEEVEE
jgi:hypothetical protein